MTGMAVDDLNGYPADNRVHDPACYEPTAGERVHITGTGAGPGIAPGIERPVARHPRTTIVPSWIRDGLTQRADKPSSRQLITYWLGCGSSHETLGFAPT